jgi:hypothetical protein
LIVPIKLGNNAVGCLEISNKRGDSTMSDNDLETLELVCAEIASGLISYEMKFNIKKEFDEELKHVKGLMNESYNSFLIPMVNDLNTTLMNIMKAEK